MNKIFFSMLLPLVLLLVTTTTTYASDFQTCIKNRTGHSVDVSLRCAFTLHDPIEYIAVPDGKEICKHNRIFDRKMSCYLLVKQTFTVCHGEPTTETYCVPTIDYCYETTYPTDCRTTKNYCDLYNFEDNGRLKSDSFEGNRCKMHKY